MPKDLRPKTPGFPLATGPWQVTILVENIPGQIFGVSYVYETAIFDKKNG